MNKKRIVAIVAIIALIAVMAVVFAACNADTYRKRLEKAGYEVETLDQSKLENLDSAAYKNVEWAVSARKPSLSSEMTDNVMVLKYKSLSSAKDAEAEFEKMAKETNEMIDLIYPNLRYIVDRESMCVFYGTVQGVNDAQK